MYYFALLLLAALIIGVWLWDKWANSNPAPAPFVQSNKQEYETNPGYRYDKKQIEYLIDCSALANQHINSRHLNTNAEVYINFGWNGAAKDFETLNHARWLEEWSDVYESKRGERNGVVLHVMDGDRELTGYEREKALSGK